jgi:hypothetical protein
MSGVVWEKDLDWLLETSEVMLVWNGTPGVQEIHPHTCPTVKDAILRHTYTFTYRASLNDHSYADLKVIYCSRNGSESVVKWLRLGGVGGRADVIPATPLVDEDG